MSPLEQIAELHQFHAGAANAGGANPGDAGHCEPVAMHGQSNGWGYDHCSSCTEDFEVPEDVLTWPARWPCATWVLATRTPEVHETWSVLVRDREPQAALEQAQALERE